MAGDDWVRRASGSPASWEGSESASGCTSITWPHFLHRTLTVPVPRTFSAGNLYDALQFGHRTFIFRSSLLPGIPSPGWNDSAP
jgi:hypothetical protein